jgi:hypothetical protein
MGGSSYSDDLYSSRAADRAARGVPTFDYDNKVKTGSVAKKVHDKLNPKGVTRESRDSAAHPDSLPIGVLLDVTGSMSTLPARIQKKIPQLMGLLIRKGYVTDPQVLFGAIGDYFADEAPLQVGQFESGLEMEDDLGNMWLEGGGGGTNHESYQLGLYFFARHTVTDAWEKRGKKGYLFIIGDEAPYAHLTRAEADAVFGDSIESNLETARLVADARERYHVFFIIPAGANHSTEAWLRKAWESLLGSENVLALDSPENVAETIAATIGICEGATDIDGIGADLHDVGSGAAAGAITKALAPLARNATGAIGKADLPPTNAAITNERL